MRSPPRLLLTGLLASLMACSVPPDAERGDFVGSTDDPATIDSLSSERVRDLAIAFHDPGALWDSGRFELTLDETRPDGPTRRTTLLLDNGAGHYRIRSESDGHVSERVLEGDTLVRATLDGSTNVTPEQAEELRLSSEAALRTRDYYLFLYGLPMKLRDPGTILDPDVVSTTFRDRAALEVRVSYDPSVGSDIWYFYFDPVSYEMFGYRFYHDESAGDGEYIVLEGLAEVGGLRLPAARTWYTHQGDRLLGTDVIRE